MPHRHRRSLAPAASGPRPPFPLGVAVRRALATGYGAADAGADVLAGLVVGVVALVVVLGPIVAQHGVSGLLTSGLLAGVLLAAMGSGALFFGAAKNAMTALAAIGAHVKVVVIGLGRVPVIDASGLVALESALDRLQRDRRFVIVAGPLPEPRHVFERAELEVRLDHVIFARDVDDALGIARDLVALNPDWATAPLAAARART